MAISGTFACVCERHDDHHELEREWRCLLCLFELGLGDLRLRIRLRPGVFFGFGLWLFKVPGIFNGLKCFDPFRTEERPNHYFEQSN